MARIANVRTFHGDIQLDNNVWFRNVSAVLYDVQFTETWKPVTKVVMAVDVRNTQYSMLEYVERVVRPVTSMAKWASPRDIVTATIEY